MTAVRTARRWTCSRCEVSVGRIDGGPVPLPGNWANTPDGAFCLGCSRERAGEAAVDAAPIDSNRGTHVKLRREGLIEFEVRRTPERTDGTIARACHSSISAVAAARSRIEAG
jgi:hypothetical protein